MSIFLIIGLIVLLYARTLKFNYIIDDNVKRAGYMYEVPLTLPDPNFQMTRPSPWYRMFMIGMHCINTWVIYMLWGWCPALLFGIHPMSVWGVAWVTGNYYATTAYFCLISFYILHAFPNIWGAMAAMPIFAAGLNSTICCVSFPFLFLLIGNLWGCSLFIPLGIYLRGKKFITGINIRDSFKANKPMKMEFTYKRFYLITKVIARYIIDTVIPNRLCLFSPYGHNINDKEEVYAWWQSPNLHFWSSLLICSSLLIGGMFISPVGTLWFFTIIALHSQWRMTGQFYAQRYVYCALPGICVVFGVLLQPYPILAAVVATFLFIRAYFFVATFKTNEHLYLNDMECHPNFAQCYNTLAQYYLNYPFPQGKQMPAWRVNYIGYLLFRAEDMEPDSWSIKMNVACFFALVGQWPVCMQKTTESLNMVRPLGGLPHPVQILEQQTKNITAVIEQQKQGVGATLPQVLQQQIKTIITLLDEQKNPLFTPVTDKLNEAMQIVESKKDAFGATFLNNLGVQLNTLIGMIEKEKVTTDPDLVQISTAVKQILEKRKAGAHVSPAQSPAGGKVGT